MASLMGRAGEQKNQYILIIVSVKIEIAYMPIGSISAWQGQVSRVTTNKYSSQDQ